MVIILLLLLLRVPVDAINYDYVLSEEALVAEREERIREVSRMGLGEEWVRCDAALVASVEAELVMRHGGVESYLEGIGVGRDVQGKIKELLAG